VHPKQPNYIMKTAYFLYRVHVFLYFRLAAAFYSQAHLTLCFTWMTAFLRTKTLQILLLSV